MTKEGLVINQLIAILEENGPMKSRELYKKCYETISESDFRLGFRVGIEVGRLRIDHTTGLITINGPCEHR